MGAFFVATVTVKSPEKFMEYSKKAGETFAPHDGELLTRGKIGQAIVGDVDHHAVGIVRFPSMDKLMGWFRSDEYQSIVALRDEAADMTIVTYEVPA